MGPINKVTPLLLVPESTTAFESVQANPPQPLRPSINPLKTPSSHLISLKKISDNFVIGDLIYGRNDKREQYCTEILKKGNLTKFKLHLSELIQTVLDLIYDPEKHHDKNVFCEDTTKKLKRISLDNEFLSNDLDQIDNIEEIVLENIDEFQKYCDVDTSPYSNEQTNHCSPRYSQFIQPREEDILGKRVFISEYNQSILHSKITPIVEESEENAVKKIKLTGKVTLFERSDIHTRRYLDSLKSSKYNPENLGHFEISDLIKNNSLLIGSQLTNLSGEKQKDLLGVQAIRRACKFGMIYAPICLEKNIHYVLDDVANESVIEKQNFLLHTGDKGVPITTSEIRFLFRNWHAILKHSLEKQIIFYDHMQTTTPPWVNAPDTWSSYADQRVNKHEISLPASEVNLFKSYYLTEQHTKALEVFFNMRFENPTDSLVEYMRSKTH